MFVAGDQVFFGNDDIELARVGGTEFGVKEGDVNRKKQTAVVLDDFGLIGWGDEFFDSQRVDIEVFLEVRYVVFLRILKINPG